MITPKLIGCTSTADASSLIEDIDCRLKELGNDMYNNIVFMLNRPIPSDVITDLLHHKRILQYKNVNTLYAGDFTVNMIANRVKLLKFKK